MRLSDVGDEAAGGLGSLGKRADVARMACAHLNDGDVVFVGQSEQRFRYAHVVVEIALGGQNIVFLGKHGTNQFFRRGFSVGARDADDGNLELAPMLACEVFEGLQRVGDEEESS